MNYILVSKYWSTILINMQLTCSAIAQHDGALLFVLKWNKGKYDNAELIF